MAINFPAGPAQGDTYSEAGQTWQYDGVKWNNLTTDANPYWTRTGTTLTTTQAGDDVVTASQNSGPLAGLRNQLINGNFYYWNRGTPFTVPTGGTIYTADRWNCKTSSGVSTTVAISAAGPVAAGLQYAIENTGSSYTVCQQGVELRRKESNLQFAIGSQWTVSFWSTGDQTSTSVNVKWKNGLDDTGVLVSSTMPNFQSTGETANGFTRYAATITITVDASTVTDSNCIAVVLPLDAGTKLAGAQFEPGPIATPFEVRPVGLELSLCQRYYFEDGGTNFLLPVVRWVKAQGIPYGLYTYPTTMRVNPTFSQSGNWLVAPAAPGNAGAPAIFRAQTFNATIVGSISVGANETYFIESADSTAKFSFDAEL